MRVMDRVGSAWVRRIVIAGIVSALVAATVYAVNNQLNGRTPRWARLDTTW